MALHQQRIKILYELCESPLFILLLESNLFGGIISMRSSRENMLTNDI